MYNLIKGAEIHFFPYRYPIILAVSWKDYPFPLWFFDTFVENWLIICVDLLLNYYIFSIDPYVCSLPLLYCFEYNSCMNFEIRWYKSYNFVTIIPG